MRYAGDLFLEGYRICNVYPYTLMRTHTDMHTLIAEHTHMHTHLHSIQACMGMHTHTHTDTYISDAYACTHKHIYTTSTH